jgi:hypothetical protein
MATKPSSRRPKLAAEGKRTVEGWRGNALAVEFCEDDLDLLDNVLTVVPILRIVAALGREARKRGLRYPVAGPADLVACLGKDTLTYGVHRVTRATIEHAMPEGWFPIAHEGELLSRLHLALLRCEAEAAQMRPRPAIHQR